jgi:colanic acid/amylovoran biosynthesis glycosyltransferase
MRGRRTLPGIVTRPTVMHCARDFVRPSEAFVAECVGWARLTRPVVACGTRWAGIPAVDALTDVPIRSLGRWAPHPDRPAGRRMLRGLLALTARAERAQLLHAHFGYWAAHTGRTAARVRRPWVLSLHGHDLLVEDRIDPEAHVLRSADAVVVPSTFLAAAASAAGFPDDRLHVMPSGVDLSRLPFREPRTSPERVTVVFAGRFVAKKGVLDAVAALALAAAEVPGLHALFVGFGPLEQDLRREVRDAGLSVEIRPGDQPGAVRAALAEADLLIMPSCTAPDGDAETLGLVAVEAQACGVPVVATRHGGLVDTVHPAAGLLVPERDVVGLAGALVTLASHPERWPAMARAGRRHVEARFALADRVAALEQLYLGLMKTTKGD